MEDPILMQKGQREVRNLQGLYVIQPGSHCLNNNHRETEF